LEVALRERTSERDARDEVVPDVQSQVLLARLVAVEVGLRAASHRQGSCRPRERKRERARTHRLTLDRREVGEQVDVDDAKAVVDERPVEHLATRVELQVDERVVS